VELGARIRRRRLARGLSQARLAETAAVSRGYISRLEAGDFARPSAALLLRIARALDLDVGGLWADIASNAGTHDERGTLLDLQDQLVRLSHALGQVRGIPIRGAGSAGMGDGSEQRSEGLLTLEDPHVPPRRWALAVRDDSLLEDGICSGDYIVVDPDLTPPEGALVVARVGDDILVKHLEHDQGTPMLEPENPDYPPISGSTSDVLGVAYAVVRVLLAT
jgi:SOS-response transcriptional repressor LexA